MANDYNPDVLNCIANLSNDEVFTSPALANNMLDILPPDLFQSKETTFLDPFCKSGVFLREIVKRLDSGLKEQIPDCQQRIDHILHHQVFGIAITELTALLSRRSLYCSKYANSKYSISYFDDAQGNVLYTTMQHTWQGGKCRFCGASQAVYDRDDAAETYAYQFIHTDNPEKIFNMTFDVIIGNPPYQLEDGGFGASAMPIYNLFVEQAKKLNPRYLCMIIPARWMTGGRGLDEFRKIMINDKHIVILHDFANSSDCFSGVEIKGGVCFFLRSREKKDKCEIYRHDNSEINYSKRYLVEPGDDIFVRQSRLITIKNKVLAKRQRSFSDIVSSMKPYGLRGDFFKDTSKYGLPEISTQPIKDGYSILGLDGAKRVYRYIPSDYPLPQKKMLNDFKIFVTRNWGIGEMSDLPTNPVLAIPGELCTETFIQIGPFKTKNEMINAYSYFSTKFFRALISIRKQDQGAGKSVYQFVPLQDFSEPWTDEKLYKKYGLTQDEIDFIESMIRPME